MPRDALRVLIGDDNEGDRQLLKDCLERAGIGVVVDEAGTGADLVMRYRSTPADCVLLDYFLPGMNGVEVLEALKTLDRYPPVVIVTGLGNEDVAVAALKAGAQDYVAKSNVNPQSISRIITNVTERVAMLRKIDAQHMDLENFARVLAHDLEAPLTALRGSATLLAHEVARTPCDLDSVGPFAASIARNARRMSALIMTLSEYVSVDGCVEFGTVSMRHALTDALANLEAKIAARHARVSYDRLPEVTGHSVLLTQLLQNLIGNSIKFCKAAPMIHISAVGSGDNGWLFSVKDNGIGIPQAQLESVFQPFTRLHRQAGYGGTGLGLATCKRIVERHQGRIWCESEEGRSSTFFFMIPMAGGKNA
ncbi:MAG: ATP-binding protein [Xanthobacteraceae bacterium]